jgi:hypothetical protein
MTMFQGGRVPHDFYPTPPEGTRALLSVERFDGSIWEPACGEGAIAKVLTRAGYEVISTDLINRGYGQGDVNFLAQSTPRAKNIVTNPPYGSGLADAFVLHALRLADATGGSVAMLLNLASLAHPKRHGLLLAHPPAAVYVLDELMCQPAGVPVFKVAEFRYCWMVWRHQHTAPTRLAWISTARFRS